MPTTLEDALKMAKGARSYARDQIRKGGTQLENNQLDPNYLAIYLQALKDMASSLVLET